MGVQGIGEHVLSLIRLRVGVGGALQQGKGQGAALGAVAVLAVVEQGDAVAVLSDVRPLLGADLEFRGVPAGVGVGGTADMAELDFIGGLVGVEIQGEHSLEQLVALMPVHPGFKVDPGRPVGQIDGLGDGGILVGLDQADALPAAVLHNLGGKQTIHGP